MSFKAKDLHYEQKEPAFLRRMRNGISEATDDPDKRQGPAFFAKKAKNPNDEDDGPTYVLEGSEMTLSKAEVAAMLEKSKPINGDAGITSPQRTATSPGEPEQNCEKLKDEAAVRAEQRTAGTGATSKKRKVVKAIGADEEDDEHNDKPAIKQSSASVKQKKKKAKVVKLQMDDDD